MLSKELFTLLDGTADAAFTVDEQGLICSWNRSAERVFGYPAATVRGKPCADLFRGAGSLGNLVCTHGWFFARVHLRASLPGTVLREGRLLHAA